MDNNFTRVNITSASYNARLKVLQLKVVPEDGYPQQLDDIFMSSGYGLVEHGKIKECEVFQDDTCRLTVTFKGEVDYWKNYIDELLANGPVKALCGISTGNYQLLHTTEKQLYIQSIIEKVTTDRVAAFAKAQLHLATKLTPVDEFEQVSFSKFGGLVQLPKNFEYPKNEDGTSQLFVAQLDLGELSNRLESVKQIREQGFLYLFAHLNKSEEHPQIIGFSIYFVAQDYDLVEVPVPDDLKAFGAYPEKHLLIADEWNLPPGETSLWEGEEMNRAEEQEYNYLYSILSQYNATDGIKLLGHPQQVQGCVLLETVLKENEQAWYNPVGYDHTNFPEIYQQHKPLAKDWRLLLELDALEDFLRELPDFSGTLNEYMDGQYYVMIRQEDLQRLDFTQLQTIYQST